MEKFIVIIIVKELSRYQNTQSLFICIEIIDTNEKALKVMETFRIILLNVASLSYYERIKWVCSLHNARCSAVHLDVSFILPLFDK